MTTLDRPATVPTDITAPAETTRGSRLLAGLSVLAPVLVGTGVLFHPDDTKGAEHTLEHLAGDERTMWTIVHLVEPFAWLLLATTLLLALPRLVADGGRGRRLVSIGSVLAFIGFVSIAFIVYSHGEAFLFMSADGVDRDAMEPLFKQFETGMPLAALPSLLSRIGLIVAGIGLLRSRTVPRWVGVLLLIAPFTMQAGSAGLPVVLSIVLFLGPLVAAMGGVAGRIATTGGPALPTAR